MTEEETKPRRDPVAVAVLEMVATADPAQGCSPTEVAQRLAAARRKPHDPPDLWRRYLQAVKQQALFLARRGEIALLRRGIPQDPHKPVKGLVRYGPPQPIPPAADDDEDLD